MDYQVFTEKDLDIKKLKPGDFILTHGTEFFDKLIQVFTNSFWNHAALITSSDGGLIELVTSGIRQSNISSYSGEKIYIVRLNMSEEDRTQVVSYAKTLANRHPTYGFLQIVSISLKIIFHSRLVIKLDGTQICSEFVANSLSEGGVIWEKDTSLITPADLYNTFVIKKGKV